jgi:hypothetical protein
MTPNTSSATDSRGTLAPDTGWKKWLRRVMLAVCCVCLALTVMTVWVRIQIDNSDRFVRTVEPVAADADIQEAVVVALTDRFSTRLGEAQTRDTLIDRQQYLAAPINALLTDYVEATVRSIVTSDQFQVFWKEASRAIHQQVSAILTESDTANVTNEAGTVTLDLDPLVEVVQTRLTDQGIDVFASPPSGMTDLTVTLVDSPDLAKVQGIVARLVSLAVIFPIIVLLALGGYLYLSPDRRTASICAGIAIAAAMVALLLMLSAIRWRYLDRISTDVDRAAAAAFFDIIGRYLRAAIRLITLLGLMVAGIAYATRPSGRVVSQVDSAGGQEEGVGQIRRNQTVPIAVLIAAACFCLIVPERLTQDWARAIFCAAIVGLAVILAMPRVETGPQH